MSHLISAPRGTMYDGNFARGCVIKELLELGHHGKWIGPVSIAAN